MRDPCRPMRWSNTLDSYEGSLPSFEAITHVGFLRGILVALWDNQARWIPTRDPCRLLGDNKHWIITKESTSPFEARRCPESSQEICVSLCATVNEGAKQNSWAIMQRRLKNNQNMKNKNRTVKTKWPKNHNSLSFYKKLYRDKKYRKNTQRTKESRIKNSLIDHSPGLPPPRILPLSEKSLCRLPSTSLPLYKMCF